MAQTGAKQQTEMKEVFTDEFYMFRAKVEICPRQDIHSYSTCPYLHLNEQSAQRRDPQLYKYDSIFCYDLHNTKACKRGPNCPYSHNLFEYFLHPSRFRTRMCEYGANCKRELCFFAHDQSQLRPRTAVKTHSGGRRSGRQHRAAAAASAAAVQHGTAAAGGAAGASDSGSSLAGSPTVCLLEVPSLPLTTPPSSSGGRPLQLEDPCGLSLMAAPQHSTGLMQLQLQPQPQPYQTAVLQQQPSGLNCSELLAPLECSAAGLGVCSNQQLLPSSVPTTQCMMAVNCMEVPQVPHLVPVSCMAPVQDSSQQVDMMGGYVIDTTGTNWSSALLAQQPVLLQAQQQRLQQSQHVLLQPAPQQQMVLQPAQQQQQQHVLLSAHHVLAPMHPQVVQPAQQQVLQLQPGAVLQPPQMQMMPNTAQLYTCLPLSAPLLPQQGSYTTMGM